MSLFGLVLAIGIVVDDAIVVVENVERNIESGLSAARGDLCRHAAKSAGPIIAIALVLVAVFVPLAFISGLTGEFYQQFALTIAISTVISAFNSLTLVAGPGGPAAEAAMAPKDDLLTRIMDALFGLASSSASTGSSHRGSTATVGGVSGVLRRKAHGAGGLCRPDRRHRLLFNAVPGGFVPEQDKQYLVAFAQLPDGASLDRTEDGDPRDERRSP